MSTKNITTTGIIETEPAEHVEWLVKGMLPKRHKCMVATLEGGCKTFLLCWTAVCVANGIPLFDRDTQQGHVLMIDEETPTDTLKGRLNRFYQGLGLGNKYDPTRIEVKSMVGYRFNHANTYIIEHIEKTKPALITIDSVIACLPGGRQGMGETNAETGITIRDDLNKILKASPDSTILITAHSRKTDVLYFDVEDYRKAEMVGLVRGHGSITGQACDTGFGLMKITENPDPTRFVIFPKARRDAIPMKETYVEVKEESYGEGWLRLEVIPPLPTPPSKVAADIYTLFKPGEELRANQIKISASGLYAPAEIRQGVQQLLRRNIIVTTANNFTFILNNDTLKKEDYEYLCQLIINKTG